MNTLLLFLHDRLRGEILETVIVITLYSSMAVPCGVNLILTIIKVLAYFKERYLSTTQHLINTSNNNISQTYTRQLDLINQGHTEDSRTETESNLLSTLNINQISISEHTISCESSQNTNKSNITYELTDHTSLQEIPEISFRSVPLTFRPH